MKSERKHICCSTDDNYAQHCGVMLCSLFENNKHVLFEIHILITSLTNQNVNRLEKLVSGYGSRCRFHSIDAKQLEGVKFRERRPLTEAAYYRILLSSVLESSISKVLYLDADIVVVGDLTPLYSVKLDGYALAATKDLAIMTDERRIQLSLPYDEDYFCSGMMILNLDYWRENNSEEELIAFSKKDRKVFNHDQDALNAVFHSKWLRLAPKWNRFYPDIYNNNFFEHKKDKDEFDKNPIIIHFSNYYKPWNRIAWLGIKWTKYRNYYYYYLGLTPWNNFKPAKLKNSQKYGIYKTLLTISFRSVFIFFYGVLANIFYYHFERIVFFPFVIILKVKRIFKK